MPAIPDSNESCLDIVGEKPLQIVIQDVINLHPVFQTILSRPQLIFDNIKYSLLDQKLSAFSAEGCLFTSSEEEIISRLIGTNYKDIVTEVSTGEVLISFNQKDTVYRIVGCIGPSAWLIYLFKNTEKSVHSFVQANLQNSVVQLKLFSHPWKQYDEAITAQKIAKLEKWLTINTFVNKPISNKLVCPKQYYLTYTSLKNKYYDKIFSAWDMQTDPEKFVHEDIGIAAYLICLWNTRYGQHANNHVNFVDIGCGNGLLVYILNQEKFNGFGIDVKSRNIWNTLFSQSTYKEHFFDPKNWEELEECNWLIGNHSDELTPWIPYVSLRVSHHCEFFVLPCCAWNFDSKYSRIVSSRSTYQCYLDHIESVIVDFGFNFGRDIMKIPSTKRTCFVSDGRNYDICDNELKIANAITIVKSNSRSNELNCVPRSKEIEVRNGTKVDRNICNKIIDLTANLLLQNVNASDSTWSPGQSIHLKDLIIEIEQNISFQDEFKNQHGGIQTVLRNNHQIFIIRSGRVSLRDWSKEEVKRPKSRQVNRKYDRAALRKSKMCWFYDKHPQGCNLSSDACQYAHGSDDLCSVKPK